MFGLSDRRATPRKARSLRKAAEIAARRRRAYLLRTVLAPTFEALEGRTLLTGTTDLAQEIVQLLDTNQTQKSVTLSEASLGGFLTADSVTISFPSVPGLTQTANGWSGEVDVSARSANLDVGGGLSASISGDPANNIDGFDGKYILNGPSDSGSFSLTANTLDLTIPHVLTAEAQGAVVHYDPSQTTPGQNLVHLDSVSVDVTPFQGVNGTIKSLDIEDDGFQIGDGDVSVPSFQFGRFLNVEDPSLHFSGVDYSTTDGFTGTIGLTAGSATLFGTDNPFSATAETLGGSYDVGNQAFNLTAGALDLKFGDVFEAQGTGLSFSVDASTSPVSVAFHADTVALSSPDFPEASGSLSSLDINDSGFSLGEGFVTGPKVKLGDAVEIDGLKVDVSGLSYSPSASPALTGTIGISATGVNLFPNSTTFTSNVTGFSASYDIQTQAVALSLGHVDLAISDVLDVSADGVSFTDDAGNVEIKVGTASATIPRLAGLTGTVTGLDITNDGFTADSAKLLAADPVKLGIFDFTGLYAEATTFGYSATSGGTFNGSLTVGADVADLSLQNALSVHTTGILGSIALGGPKLGAFTFSADTVDANLGSYLKISATGVQFDTAPPTGKEVVSLDKFNATLKAGGVSLSGGVANIGIGADGSFITKDGFGIQFGTNVEPSQFQWPSWLPIQIQKLGLKWNDFADDPTDFQIDLSASVNASIPDTQISLSGFVQDAIIDIGLLKQGVFPIVGLTGAGIGASGDLFGTKFAAELFVAVLNLDSNYQIVSDPSSPSIVHHIFYGGIDGSLDIEGMAGFEVRLGLSELGPLQGYVRDDQAQVLDPISGLTISDFRGGVTFGKSLPAITDPHQLATDPDFQSVDNLTLLQWKGLLATSVQGIAQQIGDNPVTPADAFLALTKNMTITGGATLFSAYATEGSFKLDGDVLFDTTGKFAIRGDLSLGDTINVLGYAYADLSNASSGSVKLDLLADLPGSQAQLLSVYGMIDFEYTSPPPDLPAGSSTPQLDTGLSFNGSTDDVKATGINLNASSYSVQFWAKRQATDRNESVIAQGDGSTGLNIGFDDSNRFVVNAGGTTLAVQVPDGDWHQWSVTFDEASHALAIYEDSVLVKTGTALVLSNTSTDFVIGHSGATYFAGSIDEVRVWNTPLAASTIAENWNRTYLGSQPGLIALWEFNEGQGTTAADSSGKGNDATLEGSPTWEQTVISPLRSGPFSGFTIIIYGGADLTVPGLPVDVSVQGKATLTADITDAAVDLSVTGTADIQPIGVGIGLAGFVHFDFAKNSDGSLTPELYGALVIQPSGLGQLQSIGLNIEDAYAFIRFSSTQDDHSTDVQLPNETTTTHVWIPAHSGSLVVNGTAGFVIAGTQLFQIHGELDAYFNYDQGTNDFELDALLSASLILGPASAPVVTFMADGFLQFSTKGVAGEISLTYDAKDSTVLTGYGIDLGSADNSFMLELNTTGQDVSFTTPSLEDPTTHVPTAGSTTTITVPAGPHNADGTVGAAETYLLVDGSGHLNILDSFTLAGTFDLLVTPTQFKFDVDADLALKLQNTTLLDLGVQGGILIYDQGVAAGLDLSLKAGLPSGYGFSLTAGFQLELNTTGQDQLFTLGDTGQTLDVPAGPGPYVQVHATGDLTVGSFDLSGTFDFKADASGVTVVASANTALGPLGKATVLGTLAVVNPNNLIGQTGGVYALLQATYATSPTLPGLEADLHFELLVNTTNTGRTITAGTGGVQPFTVDRSTGVLTNVDSVTIPGPEVMVEAGGHLIVANTIDLAGEFDLTAGASGLSVSANASLMGFLGINLSVNAMLGLYNNDASGPGGLVVDANLAFSSGLGAGILAISANPELIINTSPVARNGVAANTYEVALNNASVNILGLTASGSLVAGVSDGVFEIDVPASNPLNLNFFNLGHLGLSGFIRSDGHFSVTGTVGFDLGSSIGDLYGGISVTISDQGFAGSFDGGADLYTIFGTINLASASGSLVVDSQHVHVAATLYVIGIGFSFDFDIGTLSPPSPVPAIYWYSVPTTGQEGGTTTLDAQATTFGGPAQDSNYVWTVTSGNYSATYTGAKPTVKFPDPGTYQVHLAVGGLTRDSTVNVPDTSPTIQSLGLKTGYGYGTPITVSPTVTDPGYTDTRKGFHDSWTVTKNGVPQPDLSSTSPSFTFTPPAPSTNQQKSNTPPPPDIYQVTLTATDNFGGSTTSTGQFGVYDPNNIEVTTADDSNSSAGTNLRAAFAAAADSSGVHYIRFAPSLAHQTIILTQTGDKSHGNSALAVPADQTYILDASDAPGLTITETGDNRFFYVAPGALLQVQGINFVGGNVQDSHYPSGGAIYADGFLNIYQSSFLGNHVTGLGDAIVGYTEANGQGGAIYVSAEGSLTAVGDTFSSNSVIGANGFDYLGEITTGGAALGGAIDDEGALNLVGNTIVGNSVAAGAYGTTTHGAGVADNNIYGSPPRYVWNNIIADDTGATDFYTFGSGGLIGGSNLIGSAAANLGSAPSGLIATSANPELGPLADHGNGVYSYSIPAGSPAIGVGNVAQAIGAVDGRGLSRTEDGKVDIGAYEHQPLTVSTTADSGAGSLRNAVALDDDGSPIYIDPSLAGQAITLTHGPIGIGRNVTIFGPGAAKVSVDVQDDPVTDSTLVALWKGEGNTNDSAGDDIGSPVFGASAPGYVPGKVGQAFRFNGSNSVQFGDEPGLDSSSFTVAGWFQIPEAPSGDVYLASKYDGDWHGWYLRLSSNLVPSFVVHQTTNVANSAFSNAPLALNRWYYIAGTFDGATAKLYVDGQLVGEAGLSGGYTPAPSTPLYLGRASWANIGHATANIDEVAFYSTALTQAQIQAAVNPAPGNRVFTIGAGANVTISGLTISNGQARQGGAIYNSGTLSLIDDVVSDSHAVAVSNGLVDPSAQGGGVYNASGATLNVNETTFEYDTASGGSADGGAIDNAPGGKLNVVDSTFSNNSATAGNSGYGSDGQFLVDNVSDAPSYAVVNVLGASTYDWTTATSDPRALQEALPIGTTGRIASTWYAPSSFEIDVTITDGKAHQVSLYALDWESNVRNETIYVEDSSGNILHTLNVYAFHGGQYLTWNVTGGVRFVVKSNVPYNAVIAGVFFDSANVNSSGAVNGVNSASAKYLGFDPNTQGNWRGAYGSSAEGGAIDNAGAASIVSATIGHNTISGGASSSLSGLVTDGAGLASEAGSTLTLDSSVVASNTGGADVMSLSGASGGHNVVVSQKGLPGTAVSSSVDPNLGALLWNGGPTPTISLPPGSSAIGLGDTATTATVAVPGLIGWWRGEGNGTDSAGTDNGTLNGGTAPTAGKVGLALAFNGTSSYVSIADKPALDSPTFTVSGWFNAASAPTQAEGGVAVLASKYDGNWHGWYLWLDGGLRPHLSLRQSPTSTLDIAAPTSVTLNTWFQLTASFDGVTATLYLNGAAVVSGVLASGYAPSAGGMTLGVASWYPSGYFNGAADEVAFYNRALSTVEIGSIVQAGGVPEADQRGYARPYNGQDSAGSLEPQPYLVTNTNDSGPGSLRQAVIDDASGDTPILFDSSLDGMTITLTSGPIDVDHSLAITGPGASLLTIDGGNSSRLFTINSSDVNISDLTLADGKADIGGAILDSGATLRLTDDVLSGNQAVGGSSTNPNALGGAIDVVKGGQVVVTGSTFSGNTAAGGAALGGAITVEFKSSLVAQDDTFTGNTATGTSPADAAGIYGGAIANSGSTSLVGDTIVRNNVSNGQDSAPDDGSGVFNDLGGNLTLVDTIIALGGGGHDVANLGTVTGTTSDADNTNGFDFVSSSVGLPSGLVTLSGDPMLGTLQNNGGPTPTIAPLAGSPVIDAGTNTPSLTTDQRGLSRIAGASIDIGSFETAAPLVVTSTADSGPGSLRAAISAITGYAGSSTITFAPSLAGQTITLNTELLLSNSITIDGTTTPYLTIADGHPGGAPTATGSIFEIAAGTTVTLRGLTITQGSAINGGGINNHGNLMLDDDTITGNTATNGGGVASDGTLSLVETTVYRNIASSGQGGGLLLTGPASIADSTIASNAAGNTTTSGALGGGIDVAAGGSLSLLNSIVSNNNLGAAVGDIAGAVQSLGHNLVRNPAGVSGLVTSDRTGLDPLLLPLADNGGAVPTVAFLPGSPASNAGDPAGAPAVDARGEPRIAGSAIDIGALEQQNYIVTNTNDSGPGSLRQAIAQDTDDSTITFDASLSGQTITLKSQLMVTRPMTIDGANAPGLILSGGSATRVLLVDSTSIVGLRNLTIEGGNASTGGGVYNAQGTLILSSDTIAYNTAFDGAGVTNAAGATIDVAESTIADNVASAPTATASGGGIDNLGTLSVLNSTVASNSALVGGGLRNESGGTVVLFDTIVANNTAGSGPDLFGPVSSHGYNLIGNPAGTSGLVSTDLTNADPSLGALQSNGGPTPTMALLPGSAAIDAGSPTGSYSVDQRGFTRGVNGADDIGAVELQDTAPEGDPGDGYAIIEGQPLTLSASDSPDSQGEPLSYSWDINGDGVYGDATGASPTLSWSQLSALGIVGRSTPYNVSVRVDDGFGGSHMVTTAPVDLVVSPRPHVTSINGPRTGPLPLGLAAFEVTFSQPISLATFSASSVSLTLDGGPNLLTGPVAASLVPGTTSTYRLSGNVPSDLVDGVYSLTVNGSTVKAPNGDSGFGSSSFQWIRDTTAPTSHIVSLLPTADGSILKVTVQGSDAGPAVSGIVGYQIEISRDGGGYALAATVPASHPTALLPAEPGHTYAVYSLAVDAAGNVESKPVSAEATITIPIPPTTWSRVESVESSTPSLHVDLAAPSSDVAKVDLFVSVDGGPRRFVAEFGPGVAGSADFDAITDGQPHSYLFYSVGTDRSGNVEPDKQARFEGLAVSYSFAPPIATGIVVQNGQSGQSFVRYVDVILNQPEAAASLLQRGAIKLVHTSLNGKRFVPITVNSLVHATPTGLELDFGPAGIGGHPDSRAADGEYQLVLPESSQTLSFSRLLGDVNGDGKVNAADLKLVKASIGQAGFNLAEDVNGDGRVNRTDWSIVSRSLGRHLPQPPRMHHRLLPMHVLRNHQPPKRGG